ncbi:MAG: pentapeptide repeat-containing protein [Opitutales bacterium]
MEDYEILSLIGEGGFGKVFLAKHRDSFFAIKVIEGKAKDLEFKSIALYTRLFQDKLFTKNAIGLIFYQLKDGKLSYLMPLCDPLNPSDFDNPLSPSWSPKSLHSVISMQSNEASWFDEKEIEDIAYPIFDASIAIENHGFLHRDIKPDNVLFFGGSAKLCDISLLSQDYKVYRNLGTRDFFAPSWYINSGGNVDVWGIASTMYVLLTGFSPENISKVDFRYPRQNKDILSKALQEKYSHWHRCILRALSDNESLRYRSVLDFKREFLLGEEVIYTDALPKTKSNLPQVPIVNNDNKNLSDRSFHYASLNNSSWQNAILINTNFNFAELENANFTNAIIIKSELGGNRLRGGFNKEQIYSTKSYINKNLAGINFSVNDMKAWDFSGQNLEDARFEWCVLDDVSFENANLKNVSFDDSNNGSSSFYNTNFANAIIAKCRFKYATNEGFTKEQLYSTKSYKDKDLEGIDFSSCILKGWSFSGQNLKNANFANSDLSGVDFSFANLEGVNFLNANISDINLKNCKNFEIF